MNIVRLYQNAQKLNPKELVKNALELTSRERENMNRERMEDGIKADGTEMPIYSYVSQTVYGYPNTRIKLHDTGAFQKGIVSKVEGDVVHTDSVDQKSKLLKDKYSEDIFGLGGDYKTEYNRNSLQPAVVQEAKKVLYGK